MFKNEKDEKTGAQAETKAGQAAAIVPEDFKCPITGQIMLDPVLDEAGEAYEREAIEEWFQRCKGEGRPLTSPSTNEELGSDRLVSGERKIKPKITQFLNDNPSCWEGAYVSAKAKARFEEALKRKDLAGLGGLLEEEPRFATLDGLALARYVVQANELEFFKGKLLPKLALRGQGDKLFAVLSLLGEHGWAEGLRAVAEAQSWGAADYRKWAGECVRNKGGKLLKMIAHEMKQKKLDLGAAGESGNPLMHEAALADDGDMVALLAGLGLSAQAKNDEGLSPEGLAEKNGKKSALEALKKLAAGGAGPSNGGNSAQIELLQNEAQELKYQLARLEAESKKQSEQISQQVSQMLAGLKYGGALFFKALKEQHKFTVQQTLGANQSDSSVADSFLLLPDGRLATGHSYSNSMNIWDIETETCLENFKSPDGYAYTLTLLSNKCLASAPSSVQCTIKVWDVKSKRCINTLTGHTDNIMSLSQLPNDCLASGSHDKTIKVWDVESGRCLKTLTGHSTTIYSLLPLPGGHLASGSKDGSIKVWDVESGQCLQTLAGHTSQISSLAALPNGRLASGSVDNAIKVWDVGSGKCLQTLECKNVVSLATLPGGLLVSAFGNGSLKVWDLENLKCLRTINHSSVCSLFSLSDGRLVSGCSDYSIKVWGYYPLWEQIEETEKAIAQQAPDCKMM